MQNHAAGAILRGTSTEWRGGDAGEATGGKSPGVFRELFGEPGGHWVVTARWSQATLGACLSVEVNCGKATPTSMGREG